MLIFFFKTIIIYNIFIVLLYQVLNAILIELKQSKIMNFKILKYFLNEYIYLIVEIHLKNR